MYTFHNNFNAAHFSTLPVLFILNVIELLTSINAILALMYP